MSLAMCEVPVHPVQFMSESDLAALPVLPMTQAEDGTYYCDAESTQDGTPSPDNPVPIVNTYPAGTYKAICGDKTYKIVLEDDLRSVPGVADRVRIDAGRGLCWIDRKINAVELNGSNTERWTEGYGKPLSGINKFEIQIINSSPNNYGNAICTHFKSERTSAYPSENGFFRCVKIYFLFRPSLDIVDEHSISSWRTWLSANPIKVQYIVDAPTTHQYIPTQLVSISSGRSATIEGTVNDAVDMLAVKGDSWQLVQEQGKNLMPFPYDTGTCDVHGISFVVNDDGSITANGTATDNAYFYFRTSSNPITLKAGTYSASQGDNKNTSADGYKIFLRKNGGEILNLGTGDKTFELSDDAEIYAYINVNSGVTLENVVFKFMINAGDTATPYEPFQPAMPSPEYPSEIVSVEGEMGSCGWNLFDVNKFIQRYNENGGHSITKNDDDCLLVGQEPYQELKASMDIDIKNDIEYVFSCDVEWINYTNDNASFSIAFADNYGGKIKCKASITTNHIITNVKYQNIKSFKIGYWAYSGKVILRNITIQPANLPYDHHRGNAITLPVLRSLPDGTADVLYVDRKAKRAWVERNVGVKVFDGSESWTLVSEINGYLRFWYVPSLKCRGYDVSNAIMSTQFLTGKISYNECNSVYLSGNTVSGLINVTVGIDIIGGNTLDDFNAWLSANSVTVHYAISPTVAPVIEELEYSDYLLQTAQYETNLIIDCDEHLEPEISATVKVLGR